MHLPSKPDEFLQVETPVDECIFDCDFSRRQRQLLCESCSWRQRKLSIAVFFCVISAPFYISLGFGNARPAGTGGMDYWS
jgi:hypothetical protein